MFKVNHPTPTFLVLDDFYENPMDVREWILQEEFAMSYVGCPRTKSFATPELREHIQKFIEPFAGKITQWSNADNYFNANACFQYSIESDDDWIHTDADVTDWAGVLYLTPDAPLSSGTGLFKFRDGTRFSLENADHTEHKQNGRNLDAWEQIDNIGNVFNRLILFNAQHWHRGMGYFGDSKENARLFQLFFFSTERRLTHNIKQPKEVIEKVDGESPPYF